MHCCSLSAAPTRAPPGTHTSSAGWSKTYCAEPHCRVRIEQKTYGSRPTNVQATPQGTALMWSTPGTEQLRDQKKISLRDGRRKRLGCRFVIHLSALLSTAS